MAESVVANLTDALAQSRKPAAYSLRTMCVQYAEHHLFDIELTRASQNGCGIIRVSYTEMKSTRG